MMMALLASAQLDHLPKFTAPLNSIDARRRSPPQPRIQMPRLAIELTRGVGAGIFIISNAAPLCGAEHAYAYHLRASWHKYLNLIENSLMV
eukprot:COSAG01_NODE_12462_length_1734_cov_16.568807_4_plen_91_part_00